MPARSRSGRVRRRSLAARTLVSVLLVGSLTGCRYTVALFGDVPYTASQEPAYERLIDDVNADGTRFSVHVGDIQASSSTCTDATVQRNVDWFDAFTAPLVYTPGDNEWTDCSDPLARLARLRTLVHRGTGTASRGAAPRPLVAQAGYPENARWVEGRVTFVTVHVVGSSDGQSNRTEWTARRAADIAWLQQAFASSRGRGDVGIVVLGHSGLRMERAEGDKGAYESLFQGLRAETVAYPGQVLYVHGDGHTFTDDHPMRAADGTAVPNLHRVEVYGGTGTVRWIRLTVDDQLPEVFTITVPPPP